MLVVQLCYFSSENVLSIFFKFYTVTDSISFFAMKFWNFTNDAMDVFDVS